MKPGHRIALLLYGIVAGNCTPSVSEDTPAPLSIVAETKTPTMPDRDPRFPTMVNMLNHKEAATKELAAAITKSYAAKSYDRNTRCSAQDACGDGLDQSTCDVQFGNTKRCTCKGELVSHSKAALKVSEYIDDAFAKDVACYMEPVGDTFAKLRSDLLAKGDAKWLYYGSTDGVYYGYPGALWDREMKEDEFWDPDSGEPQTKLDCGRTYDTRTRPWMVSGANGPKNVRVRMRARVLARSLACTHMRCMHTRIQCARVLYAHAPCMCACPHATHSTHSFAQTCND